MLYTLIVANHVKYSPWNIHFNVNIVSLRVTSDSSLKNSWAAHGPGNSNRLEVVVIHETNISKISFTPKDLR